MENVKMVIYIRYKTEYLDLIFGNNTGRNGVRHKG